MSLCKGGIASSPFADYIQSLLGNFHWRMTVGIKCLKDNAFLGGREKLECCFGTTLNFLPRKDTHNLGSISLSELDVTLLSIK